MRPLFLPFACVLLATILPGWTQLLSDIATCDATYGPAIEPTAQTSDVRFYQKDGLKLKILFVEKKAHVVTWSSLEVGKLAAPRQIELLALSAATATWEPVEGAGPATWQRSDGLAFAFYQADSGELTIMTTEYLEKSAAEANAVGP